LRAALFFAVPFLADVDVAGDRLAVDFVAVVARFRAVVFFAAVFFGAGFFAVRAVAVGFLAAVFFGVAARAASSDDGSSAEARPRCRGLNGSGWGSPSQTGGRPIA
jgi:hypothetical protein